MRFYKTTQPAKLSPYSTDILKQGVVICISKYFKHCVVYPSVTEKTFMCYSRDEYLLEHIIEGKLTPLTQKELNKIKPHLRKEHFGRDLEDMRDLKNQFTVRWKK